MELIFIIEQKGFQTEAIKFQKKRKILSWKKEKKNYCTNWKLRSWTLGTNATQFNKIMIKYFFVIEFYTNFSLVIEINLLQFFYLSNFILIIH